MRIAMLEESHHSSPCRAVPDQWYTANGAGFCPKPGCSTFGVSPSATPRSVGIWNQPSPPFLCLSPPVPQVLHLGINGHLRAEAFMARILEITLWRGIVVG